MNIFQAIYLMIVMSSINTLLFLGMPIYMLLASFGVTFSHNSAKQAVCCMVCGIITLIPIVYGCYWLFSHLSISWI